jgi:pyruvate,water dikinase
MRTVTAPYPDPERVTAQSRKPAPKVEAIRKIIKGTAASSGMAEGPAAVLTDSSDLAAIGRIPKGAVLVCASARPDLAIVIPHLKAVAAERGGMLSAAAAAARNYGVPAVVDAAGLTAIIGDGDILRVDGTQGIVEVIEKRSLKGV